MFPRNRLHDVATVSGLKLATFHSRDRQVMVIDFEQARFAMVEQQVRPYEVLDLRVLEAMTAVKREDFVPSRHRKLAFADMALPLEHGESMMKPTLEGRMLQGLDLAEEDCVLGIGTGSGFITDRQSDVEGRRRSVGVARGGRRCIPKHN